MLAESREEIAGMADRFYVNWPLAAGSVTLEGAEAHHLAAVRRFRPGDRVCLFNGDGREYPAEIVAVARKCVELHVIGVDETVREVGFRLEVAAPLPKGDRAQFLLEKLTELGATSFTPLQTARSVVHPRETRLDKLQRYVIEASKQCGRNVLLRVEPRMEWRRYCRREDLPPLRILGDPEGGQDGWPTRTNVAVAVGPEGGFTVEEAADGRAAGWHPVSLGARILRLETAALTLVAWALRPADNE
jgi:16S rRNA (uracil1498-N3)-methyltransferase